MSAELCTGEKDVHGATPRCGPAGPRKHKAFLAFVYGWIFFLLRDTSFQVLCVILSIYVKNRSWPAKMRNIKWTSERKKEKRHIACAEKETEKNEQDQRSKKGSNGMPHRKTHGTHVGCILILIGRVIRTPF